MNRRPVDRFLSHIRLITGAYLSGLLFFFIVRIFYMFRVLETLDIRNFSADIVNAYLTGIRFDTVTICYGLVLPVIMSFISMAGEKISGVIMKIQRIYLAILLTLYFTVSIVDYYYYTYFQSHINVQIFGFVEDDTVAVIQSLWTDYPLITVIVGIALASFLIWKIISGMQNRIFKITSVSDGKRPYLLSFIFVLLFIVGLRASFGTFPVQIDDASVSSNPKVNLLPVNGVFAFKDAWYYHKNELDLDFILKDLAQNKFPGKEQALQEYLRDYSSKYSAGDSLYTHSDTNFMASDSPPHVVFFLLESWSNYNLNFHSKDLNLLGRLEPYWFKDILFRKFIAGHNGTINSIEGMMVNTPVTPIAQSEYADITFRTSCAKPFIDKGYATTFISGGKINWRNINNFIPRQHFQHVEGNADIAAHIPGTKECEWGVYDEYIFEDVFQKLEQSGGKPQFIFALTTTNHTPFHLPEDYKPYPVNLTPDLKSRLKVDEDMARKNLTNLQYTNDCLGEFLEKLEESPFAENTIVVVTGDHNNLMLFDFNDMQSLYRYGVPLLIHAPEKYLYKSEIDTSRWGSHKDIFPTIYHLSLDEAGYFNNGSNLLERDAENSRFFAINVMGSTAMNHTGAVYYNYRRSYFKRTDHDLVEPVAQPDSALETLMKRSRAYYATMVYHLEQEIKFNRSKNSEK